MNTRASACQPQTAERCVRVKIHVFVQIYRIAWQVTQSVRTPVLSCRPGGHKLFPVAVLSRPELDFLAIFEQVAHLHSYVCSRWSPKPVTKFDGASTNCLRSAVLCFFFGDWNTVDQTPITHQHRCGLSKAFCFRCANAICCSWGWENWLIYFCTTFLFLWSYASCSTRFNSAICVKFRENTDQIV